MTATATTTRRRSAKRGHGEGLIRLRSDGRWEARLTLPTGRPKSLYGKTRRDVQSKLAAALRDVQQGMPLPAGRQTVSQYVARWLEDWAHATVRPSTFASYESLVRVHLIPSLGRIPLAGLTAQHVQQMLNERQRAGVSARRRQMIHAVLRNALNRALKMRLVAHNAAADVPTPRTRRKLVPMLTPADAQRLLTGLRDDRLVALYVLALGTGLRQGELLGLRWRDVDLENETVTVGHQLQRVNGTWQLVELKADRPPRVLGIDPLVVEALRGHRARQNEEHTAAGPRWQDPVPDLIFRNAVGNPLDGPAVTHRFQRALDRAGLPRMRFQDLRHGTASLLLAQGVHARVVMEQLGHPQISLTMNTYTHVANELQREAARRLGAALGGSSKPASESPKDDGENLL